MIYKAVDIQDYTAVENAVKSSVQELGQVDILVNNVSTSRLNTNYILKADRLA